MITLKVNDIVFLEDIGVHAQVHDVRISEHPIPTLLSYNDDYGRVIRYPGQAERPEVVVTLVQVDVP